MNKLIEEFARKDAERCKAAFKPETQMSKAWELARAIIAELDDQTQGMYETFNKIRSRAESALAEPEQPAREAAQAKQLRLADQAMLELNRQIEEKEAENQRLRAAIVYLRRVAHLINAPMGQVYVTEWCDATIGPPDPSDALEIPPTPTPAGEWLEKVGRDGD